MLIIYIRDNLHKHIPQLESKRKEVKIHLCTSHDQVPADGWDMRQNPFVPCFYFTLHSHKQTMNLGMAQVL